jgi:glycosyltransferase involved in cell wall biosynthesis
MLVWQERPDLRAAFDLKRTSGRSGLFWWCLLHGFSEMGFGFDNALDADFYVVNQPFPRLRRTGFTPVTWLMRALWQKEGHHAEALHDPQEQADCLAHYFAHLLLDANLGGLLTSDQARSLLEDDSAHGVPRLFGLIWGCGGANLAARFPSPGDPRFIAWCQGEGARRWPILSHPLVGLAPAPRRPVRRGPVKGVNLFGHAHGRFGIGEDVRMAARALDAAGIPYVVRNVDAAAASNEEKADGLQFSDHSIYDVNLFCMTGISTLEFNLRQSFGLNDGRYSIGMWPWELPEWPEVWNPAWDCVDEVWAASQFTYQSFARSAPLPVYHMPMAVVADATEEAVRADFGLPPDAFLFGFSLDGLSSFARKNPLAVIAAFQRAFAPQDGSVALVLKGIRTEGTDAWRRLLDEVRDDRRIHVIAESFDRGRLLDLYRTLDAFVSLHRSEGFGRNIAEAMLLGKPVIVSAHSGNMDFTRHDSAALVPARLCPVQPGEYPFGTGQLWADPDIVAAAAAMQRMVVDRQWRESLANAGRAFVANAYSPATVGEAWARRLAQLG